MSDVMTTGGMSDERLVELQPRHYAIIVFDEQRQLFAVTTDGKVYMPDDITEAEMLTVMRLMQENQQR